MATADAAVPPAPRPRVARLSAAWFGAALALTTATQLRVGPVGPGELLLLAWLGFQFVRLLLEPAVFVPREARPVLLFWALAVPLLLAGWLSRLLLGLPGNSSTYYDAAALVLSAVSIVAFVLQPHLPERVRTAAAAMLVTAVLPLGLLLAAAVAGVGAGPLKIWAGGFLVRFMGWSTNPNQTALLMLPMPLIGLFLRSQARTRLHRLWWGGMAAAAAVIGVLTLSDSVIVAWALCAGAFLVLATARVVTTRTGGVLRQAALRVILPFVLVVGGGAVVVPLVARVLSAAAALSGSSQGEARFVIWGNGVRAISHSPLVGVGPGSHSGFFGPFEGFEVHNTYIDWATNTGVLGITLYLALLVWAGVRALRAGSHTRLMILLCMGVFSTFHYVLRQPSFWFYVLVVAFAATPAVASRGRPAPVEG